MVETGTGEVHVHTVTGIQPTVFWSLGTEETYDGGKRQAPWLVREPGAAWANQRNQ